MEEEQKFHWTARYISAYFDASPKVVRDVSRAGLLLLFLPTSYLTTLIGYYSFHMTCTWFPVLVVHTTIMNWWSMSHMSHVVWNGLLIQVERHLRLDDNILRYFTLQPRTQADLIRTKKGWKSGTWLEYDPSMQEKKEEMLAKLFGDDLKQQGELK